MAAKKMYILNYFSNKALRILFSNILYHGSSPEVIQQMNNRSMNFKERIDQFCRKGYLFGVFSSEDMYYVSIGYCIFEKINKIKDPS